MLKKIIKLLEPEQEEEKLKLGATVSDLNPQQFLHKDLISQFLVFDNPGDIIYDN